MKYSGNQAILHDALSSGTYPPNESRNEFINLIRAFTKDYDLKSKLIFELSMTSPITTSELVSLDVEDIDIDNKLIIMIRNGRILVIPISDYCSLLLEQYLNYYSRELQSPLFLKDDGQRLDLPTLQKIMRRFHLF